MIITIALKIVLVDIKFYQNATVYSFIICFIGDVVLKISVIMVALFLVRRIVVAWRISKARDLFPAHSHSYETCLLRVVNGRPIRHCLSRSVMDNRDIKIFWTVLDKTIKQTLLWCFYRNKISNIALLCIDILLQPPGYNPIFSHGNFLPCK